MKTSQLLLFLLYGLVLQSLRVQSMVMHNNDTDKAALLAFKTGLTVNSDSLNSWNESIHFCKWIGVTCSSRHLQRVSALDLPMSGLVGSISPSIGNLTLLRRINLTSNELYGEIPSAIGFLHHLEYLEATNNSLGGKITNLENCSNLAYMRLSFNKLVGEIPSWLGSLSMLKGLGLTSNNLTGAIPLSLNNLSSLQIFSASLNNLKGTIPEGLGFLGDLQFFQVGANQLSGIIPRSFWNHSSLTLLGVADNELEGSLPIDLDLPNLQSLYLDINHFSGRIPAHISNSSSTFQIDLSSNNFSGRIPPELGKLCPLALNLEQNELEATNMEDWDFLRFLSNCSSMQYLVLGGNNLRGIIPSYVANLSTELIVLMMDANHLSGSIPAEIENLYNLIEFSLSDNQLTGVIPKSMGKLQLLQRLDFSRNKLSGPLPVSIGNLTNLISLAASNNQIRGPIPTTLANLQQLNKLDLSSNALYGTLPPNIFNISGLSYRLDLSDNFLTGKLPIEIGNLKVGTLNLNKNKFYGELPETLGNCEGLVYLDLSINLFNGTIPQFLGNIKGLQGLSLSNNSFYGTIPKELSYLAGLQEINLSHNNLSGNIPVVLENLSSLYMLDLAFNHLEGPVPIKGVFSNISGLKIIGNDGLCGGIPQLLLPRCPSEHNNKKSQWLFKILIVLPIIVIFFISLITIIFVLGKKVKTRENETSSLKSYPKVSYAELVKATNNFSTTNLVGFGRYGSVYKGILPSKYKQIQYIFYQRYNKRNLCDQTLYHAIKVFNLEIQGTSRSFLAECDALRRICHRNLVGITTCCSSTDFKGKDFKALVFDFMPKGSLEKWLHQGDLVFSFIERLNIIVNVADAVNYLHNDCEPSIIHCDLKPSNILLAEDLTAHVSDFGLAKLLPNSISTQVLNSQSSLFVKLETIFLICMKKSLMEALV